MNPGEVSASENGGGPPTTPARRPQMSVAAMVVLVACCGAIFWALRHAAENPDPSLVKARSIQNKAIAALDSAKPADRVAAAHELKRLRFGDTSAAVTPLIRALEDPVPAVRVAATEALASIGSSLVNYESSGESERAAMSIVQRLNDSEHSVRVAAARALGQIGDRLVDSGSGGDAVPASVKALVSMLKDPDPALRSVAASTLGRLAAAKPRFVGGPSVDRVRVIDALAGRLTDRDADVRQAVINAIGAAGEGGTPPPALATAFQDDLAKNRVVAIARLMRYQQGLDPWVPILLKLAEHDPDPAVRGQCFSAMSCAFRPPALTPAVIPLFLANLRNPDARFRSQAAWQLSHFQDAAQCAIPDLLRLLNEPLDAQVKPVRGLAGFVDPASEAAYALGMIAPGTSGEKEVIPALIEIAKAGPVSRRGRAAAALGQFGTAAEAAVPVLIQVIHDATPNDTFERVASAASALGKIAPKTSSADEAFAAVLMGLNSNDALTRTIAIQAVPPFGHRAARAVARIRAIGDTGNAAVKEVANQTLRAIENQNRP